MAQSFGDDLSPVMHALTFDQHGQQSPSVFLLSGMHSLGAAAYPLDGGSGEGTRRLVSEDLQQIRMM
jgi:hypothetical protein